MAKRVLKMASGTCSRAKPTYNMKGAMSRVWRRANCV